VPYGYYKIDIYKEEGYDRGARRNFKVIKKELAPSIVQYMFPPRKEENHYGYNIIAVINEKKAVLIDVAFEDEASQVLDDLSANGIMIDKVIISHFHDDHMEGLKLLPNVTVYGSHCYQETLDMWTPKAEHKYFVPTVAVEKTMTIKFGNHILEIIPLPGHSVCTVLVKINEQFLYAADEILYSNDWQPLLPALSSRADIKRQLESWSKINDYQAFTIIPAHGSVLEGNKLHKDIQNRSAYAKAILMADGKITYEEAVSNCDCTFLQTDWFDDLAEK